MAQRQRMLHVIKVVNQFQAIVSRLAQLRLRSRRVDSGRCPGALAIMAEGPGRDALQMVFREAGWRLTIAETSAPALEDRKSTRLNSSHLGISNAVFCLKKKKMKALKLTQKR